MLHRLAALIVKEIHALVRDPRGRIILVAPPLLQLFIFSFASTLEVKNNTLAVWNEDTGPVSTELVQRMERMGAFSRIHYVHDENAFNRELDLQRALLAVRLPPDFSAHVLRGEPAAIQVVGDGRRSNSGQIAAGYLSEVVRQYLEEQAGPQLSGEPEIVTRHWFNPNLDYIWFIVPSLVAILTTILTMIITALSVARERELGTFEQLLVTPLTPGFILAGKAIPAFFITMVEATVIVACGVFLFQIPFQGSLWLLYLAMAAYILSLVGIGLFISSLCQTQQQAILAVFSFMLPAVLLSGYASPIDNMPHWLAEATVANPLRHFLVIARGLFLKDLSPAMVWESTRPLLAIAAVSLCAAGWLFRRKLR